jgi:hypothetical protein
MSPPILAAQYWKNNAALIADVARLGYLDGMVLDPTYGKGNWWKIYEPEVLMKSDIMHDVPGGVMGGIDFTDLPWVDNMFDAVAFDPPYVSVGGRKTTGLAGMHSAYGLTNAPTTPLGVQEQIYAGLTECTRVLKPRGYLLVKCQDYISSGKLWPGVHYTTQYSMIYCRLELIDKFEHLAKTSRAQPGGRRQVHARRNLSTLLVFRKPKG